MKKMFACAVCIFFAACTKSSILEVRPHNSEAQAKITSACIGANATAYLSAMNPLSGFLPAGKPTVVMALMLVSPGPCLAEVYSMVFQRNGISLNTSVKKLELLDATTGSVVATAVFTGGRFVFNTKAAGGLFRFTGAKTLLLRLFADPGSVGQSIGFSLISHTCASNISVIENINGNIFIIVASPKKDNDPIDLSTLSTGY